MGVVIRASMLLLSGLAWSGPASALSIKPAALHATHGDWDIYCADGVDRERACSASTSVSVASGEGVGFSVDKIRGSRGILLSIALFPGTRASAPPQVSVGQGVRLTFTDFDCGAEYCVGSLELPADILVRLRAADSATVRIPLRRGRTVEAVISLDGFGEAYDNLP